MWFFLNRVCINSLAENIKYACCFLLSVRVLLSHFCNNEKYS